jgi:tetratricopeptide (TPR) repeat protein
VCQPELVEGDEHELFQTSIHLFTQTTTIMKKIFIVAVAALFAACNQSIVPSTTPIINTEIVNEKKLTILAGHCSISSMQMANYKEWYDKNYNEYKVDSSVVPAIKPMLQNKTIEIFLGSWCGDSKREVPRMLKVLQAASFDTSNVKIIFVDNALSVYKQSPQHEDKGKSIHHVPTFIVYEGNKEMNRIVETPIVSLEKDLLSIISNKEYEPNYKAITHWVKHVGGKNKNMSDTSLHELASTMKPLCKHLGELNAFGYMLMAQKKYKQAINVFKLNTFIYPDKANVYDSLGEAYFNIGNKLAARKNYEKVLSISPTNENAKKMLEKL